MSSAAQFILDKIVLAQKHGISLGICSICSANQFAIEASVVCALDGDFPILIEATSNQVHQYGGYTGMTPGKFVEYVQSIATRYHFPLERIVIGGDHLGPHPWQNESAHKAMNKARTLVQDCVLAGYTKFHLDTSMRCADDPPSAPLSKEVSAQRAAELALVAEEAYGQLQPGRVAPRYVIGTEVPAPGGTQKAEESIAVTTVDDVRATIEITRDAFVKRGLEAAWERVAAVVVQPGVEFGNDVIHDYDHHCADELSHFIEEYPGLVYEAHSTDYQTQSALKQLVEDHFAILKVGPALTFAFREAVFALAMIEEELLLGRRRGKRSSNVRQVLQEAMLANPVYWEQYYPGSPDTQRLARQYSYSDRVRYYWPVVQVQNALAKLFANLESTSIPLSLLSQFFPVQYDRIRNGLLENAPRAIVLDKITSVLSDYAHACGYERAPP